VTNVCRSMVARRSTFESWLDGTKRGALLRMSVAALAIGCGGGGGNTIDAGATDGGSTDPVLYDDLAPTSCSLTCPGGTLLTACVCTPTPFGPGYETVRTACSQITGGVVRTPERDYCVDGPADTAPDISCMMTPRTRGTPQMVTVYGVVDVFGNGPDANDINLQFFEEGADGALGAMVASAVATTTSPCAEDEIEVDSSGVPTGESRTLGFYTVVVPSETPLILQTSGDVGLWSSLYTYNFVVLNDEVVSTPPDAGACADVPTGARLLYRARVLSRADYQSIPLTAGLAGGIRSGNGAIAGEVHDCADVRLEYATVGVTGNPLAKVYFNDIADNPLPSVARTQGTSLLGLYAGLDIAPGPIDVAAIGYVDGQSVSLGWYRARIFPDAVTAVTLRGIRAHQIE
jgi:hypothetical protein